MSTSAVSLPPSPQPPVPPQNDTLSPPPATFGTGVSAPPQSIKLDRPVDTSIVKHSLTGYDPKLREELLTGPEAQQLAAMEAKTQKENEYWDSLWKTNPSAVWKSAPRKAIAYKVHGYLQNKIQEVITNPGLGLGIPLSPQQQQKLKQKMPYLANDLASLVMPNPEETVIKAGVPPMIGGGALEGVEPSQILEGAEKPIPANLKNVTPTETPSTQIAKIPGTVPVSKAKITTGAMAGHELPPERTTGLPEADAAIKQGGGIPGGKFEKASKMEHDLHLFHDPETGTTLALPANKVTPEGVANALAESRAKYAKADAAKKVAAIPGTIDIDITSASKTATAPTYHPDLQKVVDKYGVSEDASGIKKGASFITPDGKFVHLGTDFHPEAIEKATGERAPEDKVALGEKVNQENKPQDSRIRFANETGAIRVRFSNDRGGATVHISVPAQGVNPEQIPALQQTIAQAGRYGNVVMERADITPENAAHASMTKEFARPSDAENYLRQIQAHPDQQIKPWMQQAAENAKGGFSVNPTTGEVPQSGKILSVLPEKEVDLGHAATLGDIRDYYNANKDLFEKYPELHIGGYGNELNISAVGPHAEEVAKKLDQHSIYDLGEGKEILTGGANTQKQFPKYTLEQRLADLKGAIPVTSHAKLSPIPQAMKGNPNISDESIHGHEYGHGAQAIVNGGNLVELRSHWHPESLKTGAAAATRVSFPSKGARDYSEWLANPDNAFTAMQQALAGPVTQQVVYGVPIQENPGISGDMRDLGNVLGTLGLTPDQQGDTTMYLINGWADKLRATNPLTGQTLAGIIKKYAPRNEDIPVEHLASPEKIRNFTQEVYRHEAEIRHAERNNRGNVAGLPAGAEGVGGKNVAGTEGTTARTSPSESIRKIPGAIEVTPQNTVKGSAVPLLEKPLPVENKARLVLDSEKLHRGVTIESPVVADFQKAMRDWMSKTAGNINAPSAILRRSIKLARNEINNWIMANGGEGKGWYYRKTDAAIQALTSLHPALKDPAHATIFKALWVAHSYGNDPDINMKEAEQNLTNLENTGHVAYDNGTHPNGNPKKWSGRAGNVYTLAKTQHLIDKYGEEGAANWLTTKHSWPEIQQEFKDAGLNVHKHGITLDENSKAYGSMAFGPKGGAFFLNLNGINDHTTVDIWGARALRRWEGRIGDLNTLETDSDSGLISDRPPTAAEIDRFHKVVTAVASKLNLDTDDVQALQWYFEHKLYEVHGVGERARDYEEAAKNVIAHKINPPGGNINALDLIRSLEQWKSPVQSRGNESASGKTAAGGENAKTGNLFRRNEGSK